MTTFYSSLALNNWYFHTHTHTSIVTSCPFLTCSISQIIGSNGSAPSLNSYKQHLSKQVPALIHDAYYLHTFIRVITYLMALYAFLLAPYIHLQRNLLIFFFTFILRFILSLLLHKHTYTCAHTCWDNIRIMHRTYGY